VKVVIFGNGPFASLAWYVLTHDSEHEVAGFTVDGDHRRENSLHGLPVVPFEEVTTHFPPVRFAMIAPLGFQQLNGLRKAKHEEGKSLGYRFISYISSRSITWPDLISGENSMIFEGAIVQPFSQLGTGVIVRAGASIGHHCAIGDYCFVAAGAVIGGRARIGAQCLLGLNATIRDGVSVAARCVIGAGAVVTEDTSEGGTYVGVPARRTPIPPNVGTAAASTSRHRPD
jgi:sugar O-acyltransferase (sialic acid O-acetyltransferase NeuD family)